MSTVEYKFKDPFANYEPPPKEGKIMYAIRKNDKDYFIKAIDGKTDLDFTVHGSTPLMILCSNKDMALEDKIFYIKGLVEGGAYLKTKNRLGYGVLHLAVATGPKEVVDLLLEYDYGLLESQNQNGETPLFIAIKSKDYEMFKFLITKGANVNKLSKKHETPMSILNNPDFDEHTKSIYAPFIVLLKQMHASLPDEVLKGKNKENETIHTESGQENLAQKKSSEEPLMSGLSKIKKKV